MANSRSSSTYYEYATVDTAPDADGYFTNPISPRYIAKQYGANKVFFSIREAEANLSAAPSDNTTVTVRLQFICPGDADWTDYVPLDGSSFVVGNRVALDELGPGVTWRAGVTDVDYTAGSVKFGFDW